MRIERLQKLKSESKRIIANFIQNELCSDAKEYGIITLTRLEISTDLSYLDIYVSSIKSEKGLTKFLASYAPKIQRILCKSFEIRKFPKIRFRYDSEGITTHTIHNIIKNECGL